MIEYSIVLYWRVTDSRYTPKPGFYWSYTDDGRCEGDVRFEVRHLGVVKMKMMHEPIGSFLNSRPQENRERKCSNTKIVVVGFKMSSIPLWSA